MAPVPLRTHQVLLAQARDITGVLIIANVIHLQAVVPLPQHQHVVLQARVLTQQVVLLQDSIGTTVCAIPRCNHQLREVVQQRQAVPTRQTVPRLISTGTREHATVLQKRLEPV